MSRSDLSEAFSTERGREVVAALRAGDAGQAFALAERMAMEGYDNAPPPRMANQLLAAAVCVEQLGQTAAGGPRQHQVPAYLAGVAEFCTVDELRDAAVLGIYAQGRNEGSLAPDLWDTVLQHFQDRDPAITAGLRRDVERRTS